MAKELDKDKPPESLQADFDAVVQRVLGENEEEIKSTRDLLTETVNARVRDATTLNTTMNPAKAVSPGPSDIVIANRTINDALRNVTNKMTTLKEARKALLKSELEKFTNAQNAPGATEESKQASLSTYTKIVRDTEKPVNELEWRIKFLEEAKKRVNPTFWEKVKTFFTGRPKEGDYKPIEESIKSEAPLKMTTQVGTEDQAKKMGAFVSKLKGQKVGASTKPNITPKRNILTAALAAESKAREKLPETPVAYLERALGQAKTKTAEGKFDLKLLQTGDDSRLFSMKGIPSMGRESLGSEGKGSIAEIYKKLPKEVLSAKDFPENLNKPENKEILGKIKESFKAMDAELMNSPGWEDFKTNKLVGNKVDGKTEAELDILRSYRFQATTKFVEHQSKRPEINAPKNEADKAERSQMMKFSAFVQKENGNFWKEQRIENGFPEKKLESPKPSQQRPS